MCYNNRPVCYSGPSSSYSYSAQPSYYYSSPPSCYSTTHYPQTYQSYQCYQSSLGQPTTTTLTPTQANQQFLTLLQQYEANPTSATLYDQVWRASVTLRASVGSVSNFQNIPRTPAQWRAWHTTFTANDSSQFPTAVPAPAPGPGQTTLTHREAYSQFAATVNDLIPYYNSHGSLTPAQRERLRIAGEALMAAAPPGGTHPPIPTNSCNLHAWRAFGMSYFPTPTSAPGSLNLSPTIVDVSRPTPRLGDTTTLSPEEARRQFAVLLRQCEANPTPALENQLWIASINLRNSVGDTSTFQFDSNRPAAPQWRAWYHNTFAPQHRTQYPCMQAIPSGGN